MGRAPCCEKVGLKRGRWTAEEDEILTKYIEANGEGSWRSLPKNAGLLRCGKSCRLRWINYLRTDLKRGNITTEEEQTIVKLHNSFGNRWSLIAGHLPGRTDNEIKNYWNSHLSRKIYTVTRPSVKSPSAITGILDIAPAPKRRREVSADRKGRGVTVKGKTTPSHGEKEQAEGLSSEQRQEERTLGNELVPSPIMEHGDGDMGPYDWLDGEMMRLNNEILECGVVEPSGNICYEKVTSEDQNGSCSSSMNSTLERDQWPNWASEDGVEGGLHEWELEEISSWLWGGEIAEGDDRCTET